MTTVTASLTEAFSEIDRMAPEQASRSRLFGGEGVRMGRTRRDDPAYRKLYSEAAEIYESALKGNRYGIYRLKEAMSTSDFPFMFGDIIARQLLPAYEAKTADWRSYFRRATVPDFRTVKRYAVDGDTSVLQPVGQGAPYPASSRSETQYEYAVAKYGRQESFLWEAIVNDDLDALKDSPEILAQAAVNTEDWFATSLYADTTGPNSSFFNATNRNLLSGPGSFLSEVSLAQAFTLFGQQVSPAGTPIRVTAAVLVVPPSLEIHALKILNATEIELPNDSGGLVRTNNWLRGRTTLVVNPWLPLRSTGASGDPWYLFAAPTGRPAGEIGFLRGNEQPAIFMKAPNQVRVGGGPVDPMEGDFETDGIATKVRHVLGGTLMDYRMAVASEGIQGS